MEEYFYDYLNQKEFYNNYKNIKNEKINPEINYMKNI